MNFECPNFDNYLTREPDLGEPCFDCKSQAPVRDGLCGDCIEEREIQADIEESASERDEAERNIARLSAMTPPPLYVKGTR